MIPKVLKKSWPFLIISAVIFLFFIKLFFPHQSIFITPDYGRSDSWHLSIANKFYFAQELKKNRIPIWNPHIGTGYPTLAEGQTGIFFLPNLILFRFLPFVLAYNLTLVLAFTTAGIGTYLFSRSLQLTKVASLYAGLIFPLGGFFVVHVQHHHLLQTASMMPLLFWTTNEFLEKRTVKYLILLSLFLSQQIFAGFPQLTFYSLVALVVYVLVKHILNKSISKKLFVFFCTSITLGFLIASPQLIPNYEFLKFSSKENNPRSILEEFPYKPINLFQFIDPFILGSHRDGTYPAWEPGKWGIYWESIAYVGVIPLVISLAVIFGNLIKKNRYRNLSFCFSLLAIFSILLSLGTSSPLHPVFSFPPFSMFRVPSRFLLITQFSLVILSAIYVNKISSAKNQDSPFRKNKSEGWKPILAVLITIVSVANLLNKFINYNPTGKASEWFQDPESAKWLKQNKPGRTYSIGQQKIWNDNFLSQGWRDTSFYYFARNSLDQNSNLIFNLDHLLAYESLATNRGATFKYKLVEGGISLENSGLSIENYVINLIKTTNVTHIITPFELLNKTLEKKFQTENFNGYSFKIYAVKNNPQRYFIVSKYQIAHTIPQITSTITNDQFNPLEEAIIEKSPPKNILNVTNWTAKLTYESPTNLEFSVFLDGDGLFILSDSIYPGWRAFVDGKPTEIIPANIDSRAVFVPQGNHLISFKFQPRSLNIGIYISLATSTLTILTYLKFRKAKIV